MTATGAAVPYEGERGITGVFAALQQRGWKPSFGSRRRADSRAHPRRRVGDARTGRPARALGRTARRRPRDCQRDERAPRRASRGSSDPLGISWLGVGFHPFARQEDLPWVPKLRYAIMREYLPKRGNRALDMMRRTATVQANFDYGSEEDAMRKMRVSLRLSPIVTGDVRQLAFLRGQGHRRAQRTRQGLAGRRPRSPGASCLRCGRRTARSRTTWSGRSTCRCSSSSGTAKSLPIPARRFAPSGLTASRARKRISTTGSFISTRSFPR